MIILLASCSAHAQEKLAAEIEELFTVQEQLVTSYRWNFECLVLELKPEHTFDKNSDFQTRSAKLKAMSRAEIRSQYQVNPDAHRTSGSFLYDVPTCRLLVESVYIGPASEKRRDASSKAWAFDGKQHVRFDAFDIDPALIAEALKPGPKLKPRLKPQATGVEHKNGWIETKFGDGDNFSGICRSSGLFYFPQFCPSVIFVGSHSSMVDHRRSHYLRTLAQKHQVQVCQEKPGLIGLTYEVKHETREFNGVTVTPISSSTVLFDTAKKGAIAWLLHHRPGQMHESNSWTEVVSTEVAPGVWLPSEITSLEAASGSGSQILITDVVVNPDINDRSFTYQMPPETQVVDEIRGKRYIVPESEATLE